MNLSWKRRRIKAQRSAVSGRRDFQRRWQKLCINISNLLQFQIQIKFATAPQSPKLLPPEATEHKRKSHYPNLLLASQQHRFDIPFRCRIPSNVVLLSVLSRPVRYQMIHFCIKAKAVANIALAEWQRKGTKCRKRKQTTDARRRCCFSELVLYSANTPPGVQILNTRIVSQQQRETPD